MAKVKYILSLFALALTGCSSMQLYVDDAYHWEDKTPSSLKTQSSQTTPITQNNQSTPSTPETPASETPTLEYLNVQDTTVTVRIRR